jgi:hypothetical protein
MSFIGIEADGSYTKYDDKGNFAGYGEINSHIPSIKADELSSRLGVNDDEGLEEARRVKQQYKQSRAGVNALSGAGQAVHDREYADALATKRKYQADRKRGEEADEAWVSEMTGLADGTVKVADLMAKSKTEQDKADDLWVDEMVSLAQGKHPGSVVGEMRILKPASAERVKEVATKQTSSDDPDDAWVREMLQLVGQEA